MSATNGNGAATTAAAAQASQKPEPSPALDDEFEDFPHEDWDDAETELGVKKQWEDSWDDDNLEDDFSKQLMAELSKQGSK